MYEIDNPYLQDKEHIAAKDRFAEHGVGTAIDRAVFNESLTAQAVQATGTLIDDMAYEYDPTYTEEMRKADIDELKKTIHPDFVHNLDRAKNKEHMQEIAYDLEEKTNQQEYFESLSGVSQFFFNLGANMLDIPLIMGAAVSSPIVAPSLIATGTATLGRRMLFGAGTEVVLEGMKDVLGEKDRTAIDYTLGAVFGAGVAGVFKNHEFIADASERTIRNTLELDTLEKNIAKATTKDERKKVYENHMKGIDLSQAPMSYKDAVNNLKDKRTSKFVKNPMYDALRVDLAYLTAKSKSKSLSSLADQLYIDATNQANKADVQTLVEQAAKIEDQIIDNYSMANHDLVLRYGKLGFDAGFVKTRFSDTANILSNIAGEAQMRRNLYGESLEENQAFIRNELQKRAVRKDLELVDEKELTKLSKDIQTSSANTFTKAHDILVQNGKIGFGEKGIPKTDTYMPIMYNRNMAEIISNKGLNYKHFKDFIVESALSKLQKDGMVLNEAQIKELKNQVEEIAGNIWKNKSNEQMINQSFDDMFKAANIDLKGISKFTEGRSPLDYSYKKVFINSKGKESELSFMDLVETDMTGIVSKYSRKMGGAVALEKASVKQTVKKVDEKRQIELNSLSKKLGDIFRSLDSDVVYGKSLKLFYKASKETGIQINDFEDLARKTQTKDANIFAAKLKEIVESSDEYADLTKLVNETNAVINSLRKQFDELPKEEQDEFIDNALDLFAQYKNLAKSIHNDMKKEYGGKLSDEEYNIEFAERLAKRTSEINFNKMNDFINDIVVNEEVEVTNLTNAENIKKARSIIEKELEEAGATRNQIADDLVRFDETVKELQGLPTATDPFSLRTQAQRIAKNLNIARLLGQTGWTMTAELGSTVFESGVKNFMEFSSFREMFKQFRTGKIDDKLAKEIQLWTGLGANLNRAIGVNKYEHDFSLTDLKDAGKFESALNKIESISEKFTEATLLFGGVKPLTAGFEMVMAKSILQQVMDISGKKTLKSADKKFLNEIGLSEDMVQRVFGQMEKHSKFVEKKWSNGHKVQELNFDKWDDVDAQDMLIAALRRKSHQVIQRSGLGDKTGVVAGENLFKNTLIGRFFLELKDYMITSYVKQFGRMLERRDMHVVGLLATQAAFLTIGSAIQNYTNYVGNEDKLKKSFEPENFLRTVVGRLPASSYIPTIADNAARLTTGDTIFSSNRYHSGVQDAFMSMPTVDLLAKVGDLFSMPYKAATGEFGGKEIDSIFGLAPLGNTYGVKTAKEYLKAVTED